MHSFKISYVNELYKMSKKKKISIAAIMCLAIVLIGAAVTLSTNNFIGINLTGKSEFSIIMLPVFVNIIIPLFVIFVCIDMFCGEFASNTIKTTLLTPASRIKIFSAKLCAAMTFIAGMLALVMISSFIISIPIGHTEFDIVKIFISYIVSIFPLAAFCMLASLISNLTKGSGSSFMLCIIVFMVLKVLEILNPEYSAFFFTSGFSMYVLLNAPLVSFAKLARLILIDVGCCTMLFALGYALFDSKEI